MKEFFKRIFFIFFFFVSQLYANNVVLADISVIVHPDNQAVLSVKDIQRIFHGKMKEFSAGQKALPINQPFGSKPRKEFIEKVLKLDEKQERISCNVPAGNGVYRSHSRSGRNDSECGSDATIARTGCDLDRNQQAAQGIHSRRAIQHARACARSHL